MPKKEEPKNLTKKERKEYLKVVRSAQDNREKKLTFIFGGLIVFGVLAAIAGLVFLSNNKVAPADKNLGQFVASPAAPNDHLHVVKGQPHVPYTSNPPSSGPHYNGIDAATGIGPIPCTAYTKEVDDESAVHDLEHGAVWVTYHDINDKTLASQLKAITDKYSKVLLSPRSKDDTKIAVVSWERVLKLDKFDSQKIEDFIKLYRSSEAAGAERFASCGTVMP